MKFTKDFSEYSPWSGAEDTYEKIVKADKLDELESFLEEYFGDVIPSETAINDLLWFDGEYVLSSLGLAENEDDFEEDELDDVYHDCSEEELREMGAFDNLNTED